MSAPIGNQFWKQRTSHGVQSIMTDPAKLCGACTEYFEWITANPLTSEKVSFDKDGCENRATIYHPHAMTIWGLSTFLGISDVTWYDWRKNRADLKEVITWAESIIKQQKFSAAAAGLLNANIISRELGLADKILNQTIPPAMTMEAPDGERPPPSPIHGE